MYGQEKAYVNRDYDAPTAAMDPYTVQIVNRLAENEKILTEILSRVYRLNDKLFGPLNVLSKAETSANLGANTPVPKAMMEQIVGQSNVLNRRLGELSEAISRLETL